MEQNSELLNELRQWGSPLAEMRRHMPFVVEEDYFTTLPEVLSSRIADSEVGNKPMPHPVPDGYFETLAGNILARVKSEETIPQLKRRKIAFPLPARIAAAALLLAAGWAGYKHYDNTVLPAQQQLAAIPAEEIHQYLGNYLDDMDADLLAGNLADSELNELEQLHNDEIIEYLNDGGWDTSAKN